MTNIIMNLTLAALPDIIPHALSLMGMGMLAIFIAIGVIFLSVVVMNFITKLVRKRNQK